MIDGPGWTLAFGKEFAIELVDLRHIRKVDEREVDINDVTAREARCLSDPENMRKGALGFLPRRARQVSAIGSDGQLSLSFS